MKRYIVFIMMAVSCCLCVGCLNQEKHGAKENVDYAVCKELAARINEQKDKVFHFTYSMKETMYYVIGYGKQTGSGYKVRVKKMTMDEGHVYIDTNLIGVPKRQQEKGYSYPYIVIKSQNYEKDVVFL